MLIILLAAATFVSTFAGGLLAIKYQHKLHLILGFTAGVLLGVVSFDIFPEIIHEIQVNNFNSLNVMIALVVGFLLFHILEKVIVIHHAHEGDYADHKHPHVGMFSALALAGHSLMDGVGIGLGFQVNPAVGALVALAVISHDFTDGMNTVGLMLAHKNTAKKTKIFLLVDALAPIAGALSTLWFQLPAEWLVLYLGFFAGFLLYIGASDILPEAHSQASSFKLIGLTVLGTVFVFLISNLV